MICAPRTFQSEAQHCVCLHASSSQSGVFRKAKARWFNIWKWKL